MPSDVERLAVLIEANTKSYERAMVKLQQQTDKAAGKVEKRFRTAGKRLESTFSGFGAGLNRALGVLGVGIGVRELQRFADQFTSIQNALKVTGLEGTELTRVYDRLFVSAQKSAAPLQALAVLYGRVALVQKELNVSTDELLQFTDHIALALRVSGQSAEQSSGALLQLSQALGGGVVHAEEFNAVLEGALPIAQAAAAGLTDAGGSVAKLRSLVIAGKVSSQAFFQAFEAGSGMLAERAGGMQVTIGQAFTQFSNVLTDSIGRINNTTGASEEAVRALNDLGEGVKFIADHIDAAAAPFNELIGFLEDIHKKAMDAAKAFGELIGLDKVGKAIDRATGISHILGKPELETGPGGLMAEGANSPLGHAPAPVQRLPVSLSDFSAPGAKKGAGGAGGAATVGVDSFERAIASAKKHIAIMNAETATIDETVAARERARIATELETAARAANQAQGMANIEVTAEQRVKIDEMSEAMYGAAEASEYANSSLATAARVASQLGDRLEDAAVSGADGLANAFADVVTGAATAAQAFKQFAASVVSELVKIIAKLIIINTLKAIFAVFGFSEGGPVGGNSNTGFSLTHTGGRYASGGSIAGPGSGTSDSIPAFLSNGEYVVNADAAQRNRDLLDAINFGSLNARRFADGGPVSGGPSGSDRFEPPPPREIRITGVRPDDLFTGRQLLEVINATIADGGRLRVVPA